MDFPEELIDEILSYSPLYDRQSLRNCSLVAKSWTSPSRRRLFKTVSITNTIRPLWLENISPSNVELLRHVRSFFFICYGPRELYAESADFDDLCVYFPSFHRLHTISLSFARISFDIPERIEMFSPCQQFLSCLTLTRVFLRLRPLIALIDYFPNIRTLRLFNVFFGDDNKDPPPLSRPLRGQLALRMSEEESPIAFSNWFTGVEVEYEELAVDVGYGSGPYCQNIINFCRKTLKLLSFPLLTDPISLLHCPELRELQLPALGEESEREAAISSVASVNFWKITFLCRRLSIRFDALLNYSHWESFDNCMSTLADKLRKLGNKRTLEVEFRFERVISCLVPVEKNTPLPKFGGRGRVKIVDSSDGRVFEFAVCSFSLRCVIFSDSNPSERLTGLDA